LLAADKEVTNRLKSILGCVGKMQGQLGLCGGHYCGVTTLFALVFSISHVVLCMYMSKRCLGMHARTVLAACWVGLTAL